eukprot:5163884-Pyramimonas_sp.AAC.1
MQPMRGRGKLVPHLLYVQAPKYEGLLHSEAQRNRQNPTARHETGQAWAAAHPYELWEGGWPGGPADSPRVNAPNDGQGSAAGGGRRSRSGGNGGRRRKTPHQGGCS